MDILKAHALLFTCVGIAIGSSLLWHWQPVPAAIQLRTQRQLQQSARGRVGRVDVSTEAPPDTSKKGGEEVLFSFDSHALPLRYGVGVQLVSWRPKCGTTQVVLRPGEPGQPDTHGVVYYGTVVRVGGRLQMFYIGLDEGPWHGRVCVATSEDGLHWTKPVLGLATYRNSTANNLVFMEGWEGGVYAVLVLHEPQESTADRQWKMLFKGKMQGKTNLFAAFSQDGLWWKVVPTPLGLQVDVSGIAVVDGCYHLSAHGPAAQGARKMHVFVSCDFLDWGGATAASSIAFTRSGTNPERVDAERGNTGEQVHQGAALWHRGSVILGVYGQWHGHPSNDRRLVYMDLGLVVSSDGMHFREPLQDFRLVAAAEDGWEEPPSQLRHPQPALMQGQGFENIGNETLFWYGAWPEAVSDGVRVARWPRDRLGLLRPSSPRGLDVSSLDQSAHIISRPVSAAHGAGIFLNVRLRSQHAHLAVSLLDTRFLPLRGYSGHDVVPVMHSGLRQAVTWRGHGHNNLELNHSFRIRVDFHGLRKEDADLYAIYIA